MQNGTNPVCSLTDVLSHAVGVLAPFWEALDQVTQHGWHLVDGIRVVVEEDLPRTLVWLGEDHTYHRSWPHCAIRLLVGLQVGPEAGVE